MAETISDRVKSAMGAGHFACGEAAVYLVCSPTVVDARRGDDPFFDLWQ